MCPHKYVCNYTEKHFAAIIASWRDQLFLQGWLNVSSRKLGNSPALLRAIELFARMCKHRISHQSGAAVFLESCCGRSVLVCRLQWPCPPVPLASVSDSSVVLLGLLWGLAGYWQHSSMGQRWQFSSCTLRFNPFWLLWLKVAQTGDYTSVTAGEEVTHHTLQIRLNKHSVGCVDMEICLSRPGLGWISRLKSAFKTAREQPP